MTKPKDIRGNIKDIKKKFEDLPAINKFLYFGVLEDEPNIEVGGIVHLKLFNDAMRQIWSFFEPYIKNYTKDRGVRR